MSTPVSPLATPLPALPPLAGVRLAAAEAGNVAIPLVHSLTAEVAKRNKTASGFVHWGATSQDVIDTAMALVTRDMLGHIGADLITLASMLRIPVYMHNVAAEKVFRPSTWAAFGTADLEGADYRACKNFGPLYA